MKHKNWFWGIFFLAAAVFVVASQVGAFVSIGFWSIAATVALAAVFVSSIVDINFFGILISAALLYKIYQKPLDLYNINFWLLMLAVVLASIGLSAIFHSPRRWMRRHRICCDKKPGDFDCKIERHGKSVENLDGNDIYAKASFTEACRYLHSDSLKKAELTVSFGELKVYFDQVQLDPAGAEVLVDVSFGEMQLYLPKGWHVIDNVSTSLGSAQNVENRTNDPGSPVLTISGRVSLGELSVHYV